MELADQSNNLTTSKPRHSNAVVRKFCFLVLLGSWYLSPVDSIAQDFSRLIGTWENELGSQLILDSISTNGDLWGKYRSSSGVDGRIFPLKGWVNGKEDQDVLAISFTVKWQGYGSITGWTGYFDQDTHGDYLKTLWHLIRPDEEESWERVITNSSLFRRPPME